MKGITKDDIHGYKLDGRCEHCEANRLTYCFRWQGRGRQFCRKCLLSEFGIKILSIFDKLKNQAPKTHKKLCPECKKLELVRDGYNHWKCLSCKNRFLGQRLLI